MPKEYYDLTAGLSENIHAFPGDPPFKIDEIQSLDENSHYNLSHFHMGNHTGTHIDFPAHVIKEGKTSSDYPLESLIGHGLIIEIPEFETSIKKKFIENKAISSNDFVFFSTANKHIKKQTEFSEKFVYIEEDAANFLIEKGVRIVGIDYLSVDNYEREDLPVHHALLKNEVLIVEGLNLDTIPEGRYKIYIFPLKILEMDGLPVRVMAKSLASL